MRTRGIGVILVILLGVWAAPRPAEASESGGVVDAVGVASAVNENTAVPEAHGWVRMPGPDASGPVLVHFPPRPRSVHGGRPGVARRLTRPMAEPPLRLAADGRRLYLLFDGSPRKLLSIEAAPTPIEGIWTDIPPGLMTPSTPPPDHGVPVGMASAGGRVHILFERDGVFTLDRLDGGAWNTVELPPGLEPGGVWAVFGDRLGLSLVRTDGDAATIHRLGPGGGWTKTTLPVARGTTPVGVLHGRVVFLEPDGEGRAGIVLADAAGRAVSGSFEIPRAAAGSALAAVVIPDASGRLVLLWGEAPPGGAISHMIREISLSTGAVLYDASVNEVVPVSPREFQLMALGMLVVMIVSLYVVLRPVDDRGAPVLPEGFALASPGRRFAATVLDVFLSALPVSWAVGVPVGNIITFGVVLDPGDSWVAVPAMFTVGLVSSTVMEALFGGTVGKLMLGCRVVPARGDGRRLGLRRSFLRNLIKWVLPPVAGLAMLDPTGRHRGDLLAGAVVVVAAEPGDRPAGDPGGPDTGPSRGPGNGSGGTGA